MTTTNITLDLMALAALLPAAALGFRQQPQRDAVFWLVTAAAFIGPFLWSVTAFSNAWRADLAAALWLSVAIAWGIFAFAASMEKEMWRLASLLGPLMLIFGIFAVIWSGDIPGRPLSLAKGASAGLGIHIAVSVTTYAIVTLAAVAGFAGILQDRALKAKQPTRLTRELPSLTTCDDLMIRLLGIAEAILALGLISGMALNVKAAGSLLTFDHKTILAVGAFTLIAILLVAHRMSGLRGRKAARWALSAYLCLTMGYPGVKFVTDVILT